jgi:hypothetical protein
VACREQREGEMKKPRMKVKVKQVKPGPTKVEKDKAKQSSAKVLEEMNKRHAVVSFKGKFRVMTMLPCPEYPTQNIAEFSSKFDFTNLNVHPKVSIEVKTPQGIRIIKKDRGAFFLDHEKHNHFDGIDFRPAAPAIITRTDKSGRTTRYANMFSGFSVEPKSGNCEKYLQHVHDNISGGEQLVYDYNINWMASGVQHPDNPGRAAISLRGDPGVGKGVFATEYGKLYGRHFLHLTNSDQITGRFNAISAESLLIFADEAMFFGDRKAAQVLKTLVSEKTKILEKKGVDSIQIPNYSRLIFSTNDEHPLRIEAKDRRYQSLYVGTDHIKDRPYFTAILKQMNDGGRAALLSFLLKRNISKFNPEDIPDNNESLKQKLASAPAGDRVIFSFAQDCYLPCGPNDDGGFRQIRPSLARARGPGFLFEEMRRRGGRDMQYLDEVALTEILKAWGFTRHHMNDGAAWAALPLKELRANLIAKYPAIKWDHPYVEDWGDKPDMKRQKERQQEEQQQRQQKSKNKKSKQNGHDNKQQQRNEQDNTSQQDKQEKPMEEPKTEARYWWKE